MKTRSASLSKIAKELGLNVREARARSIRLLVLDELRRVLAEKQLILNKYGVSCFKELMEKVSDGSLSDVDIHDDIVRLDYLEYREKTLRRILNKLL